VRRGQGSRNLKVSGWPYYMECDHLYIWWTSYSCSFSHSIQFGTGDWHLMEPLRLSTQRSCSDSEIKLTNASSLWAEAQGTDFMVLRVLHMRRQSYVQSTSEKDHPWKQGRFRVEGYRQGVDKILAHCQHQLTAPGLQVILTMASTWAMSKVTTPLSATMT